MTTWFHCNDETGAIVASGMSSTIDEANLQPLAEGHTLLVVPDGLITGNLFGPTPPDITLLKDWLVAKVDEEAEAFRSQFATPGSGQAMEYQEAVAQALALGDGKSGPFLMLDADVVAGTVDPRTGRAVATVQEAADLILWMHAQWVAIGSDIRQARLSAKVGIRAAETIGAAAIASKVDWAAIVPGTAP